MSNFLKFGLVAGTGFLLVNTLRKANTVKNLTFAISKIYKNPSGKGFKFSLQVTNPTDGIVTLDYPYIQIKVDGTLLADNAPLSNKYVIAAKQRTVIDNIDLKADNISLLTKFFAIAKNKKAEVFVRSAIDGNIANLKIAEFALSNLAGLSGLGLVASGPRDIKDGSKYDHLFPAATSRDTIVEPDGNVKLTVELMEERVRTTLDDTKKIAALLDGKSIFKTSKNTFDFLFNHVQYKLDKDGVEELRRPRRSWADRTTGIDCDCFSIFAGSILTNLGIDYKFIITKYNAGWQHVYVIVPDKKNKTSYIIDCVLDEFNVQKPYSDRFFHNMEALNGLGMPIAFLDGLDNSSKDELSCILNGVDFDEVLQSENLNGVADSEIVDNAVYNHLVRTRNYIAKNPRLYPNQKEAIGDVQMLDYALDHWEDKAVREQALNNLISNENDFNSLQGVGEDNLLGKGFFQKVASVVSKPAPTPSNSSVTKGNVFNRIATGVKNIVTANPIVKTIQRTGSGALQRINNMAANQAAKSTARQNILTAKGAASVKEIQAKEKKRVNKIASKSLKKVATQQKKENRGVFHNLKVADRKLTKANEFAQKSAEFTNKSAFVTPQEIELQQQQFIEPAQNFDQNAIVDQQPVEDVYAQDVTDVVVDEENSGVQQDYIQDEQTPQDEFEPSNETEEESPSDDEFEDDTMDEESDIQGVIGAVDFDGINGLGNSEDENEQMDAIHDHIARTHNVLVQKYNNGKTMLGDAQIDLNYIGMLGRAVDNWNSANLLGVLTQLVAEEDRWNIVSGLGHLSDDAVDGLGRPAKKQFFSKIKTAVENIKAKVSPAIKKVGAAIVRYNPISLAVRGSFLLGLKINIFKIAERLYPAYLTPQQASQQGFKPEQVTAAKVALAKVEKMFVKRLKGTSAALKQAVMTGRAAKKIVKAQSVNGFGQLGEPEAAVIITAAAPLLTAFIATSPARQQTRLQKRIAMSGFEDTLLGFEDTLLGVEEFADTLMGVGEAFQPNITEEDMQYMDIMSAKPEAAAADQAAAAGTITGKELTPEQKKKLAGGLTRFIVKIKDWFKARRAGKDANATVSPEANDPSLDPLVDDSKDSDSGSGIMDYVMENPGKSLLIGGAIALAVSPKLRNSLFGGSTAKKPILSGLGSTTAKKTKSTPTKKKLTSITLK